MSKVVVEHDLRPRFGTARDQGQRPTCLAFAVSDAHAAVRAEIWQPLSCEYLFYHASVRAGSGPNVGATLSAILEAIEQDGQPDEAVWSYMLELPGDPALWVPPADVGEVFCRRGELAGSSFEAGWTLIAAGRPAVLCMTISDAFYMPYDGIIDAVEPVDPVRRHGVVAVAAAHRGDSRLLLVRNSWGTDWGTAGHAWLAETYLAPRVFRVIALTREAE